MTYQVIVRPEAAREIQDALDWYEEKAEDWDLSFCVQRMLVWQVLKEVHLLLR